MKYKKSMSTLTLKMVVDIEDKDTYADCADTSELAEILHMTVLTTLNIIADFQVKLYTREDSSQYFEITVNVDRVELIYPVTFENFEQLIVNCFINEN